MSTKHQTSMYRVKSVPTALADAVLKREQRKLYRRFEALLRPQREWRVLNLGVNGDAPDRESAFFEFHYPWREHVVSSGLEPPEHFQRLYPEVTYVQASRAGPLPFKDQEFDLVFCNAVIEHVGARARQREFLEEIARVGRRAFVTTPNRWYPVELHTVTPLLHWLPPAVTRRAYRALGFDFFAQEENLNLLDADALVQMVPPAVTYSLSWHRFLGLRSNIILVLERRR